MEFTNNAERFHACHSQIVADEEIIDPLVDYLTHPSATQSLNNVEKPLITAEFSKQATHYDAVAVVQRRIADRVIQQAVLGLQETLLKASQSSSENFEFNTPLKILDAGCGTGYVGYGLLKMIEKTLEDRAAQNNRSDNRSTFNMAHNYQITALDLSDEMLAAAQNRAVYSHYQQGDIEALPFLEGDYDLVVSSLAIQWCHHPARAISELVRVVKGRNSQTVKTDQPSKVIVSTLLDGTLRELSQAFKTIDDEQHVLDFMTESALSAVIQIYNGTLTVYEEVVKFDSLKALFQSLKNIGATALPNRRKGLLGRKSYQKLDHYFQKSGGYQLTYVVALIEISF